MFLMASFRAALCELWLMLIVPAVELPRTLVEYMGCSFVLLSMTPLCIYTHPQGGGSGHI